jgi:hypothetical protein
MKQALTLLLLVAATAASALAEPGVVVKYETQSYSQSAHIIRDQIVYTVHISGNTYQVTRHNKKIEFAIGQQIECRIDKSHLFVMTDKGKETKYDIVGAQ